MKDKLKKAMAAKRSPATQAEDQVYMDMINEDRMVDPNSPYQTPADMVDAVNSVTKSGEALRKNIPMSELEQNAADKKAYMLMMKKRKQGK